LKAHGPRFDAFSLESTLAAGAHTYLGRAERVAKDELFPHGSAAEGIFTVNKISAGYIYDFLNKSRTSWGAGAVGSVYLLPQALEPFYGKTPLAVMIFIRAKLI